jgi:hypothetical protein
MTDLRYILNDWNNSLAALFRYNHKNFFFDISDEIDASIDIAERVDSVGDLSQLNNRIVAVGIIHFINTSI